jgi:hypothetical protein
MTPQEAKELFIQSMINKIKGEITGTNLTTRVSTCSSAPAFGWSVQEYMYMPLVAERLRTDGYQVSSQVNHGVIDWTIAV